MLPFGLKLAWFVLSLTGWVACAIVLYAFGRGVKAMWVTTLYTVGCALLQGTFCLGLIYRMDPFLMPKSFCLAQTIIISFGAFLLTGVALVFSLATSMTVLKPKFWGEHTRTLRWRNIYCGPLLVFPVVSTGIHIAFIFKFDSVHPSDDFHCDSSAPEWVRFMGYAGIPLTLSLPSLYLSIKSIIRVYRTNQHIQRARSDESGMGSISLPSSPSARKTDFSSCLGKAISASPRFSTFSEKDRAKKAAAEMKERRLSTKGDGAGGAKGHGGGGTIKKFHLPFRGMEMVVSGVGSNAGKGGDETRESSQDRSEDLAIQQVYPDDNSSKISLAFPTFARPPALGGGPGMDNPVESRAEVSEGVDLEAKGAWTDVAVEVRDSEEKEEEDLEYDPVKDDFVVGGGLSPRRMSFSTLAMGPRRPRRPPPNLSPAVWRIILFQVCFVTVQILAAVSTLVDVATSRPVPTPLGSQHFALLLAAWGPVIIFGHLPTVRRNLIPWRPIQ